MRSPIYLLQVYEEYLYFLGKDTTGCDSTCYRDSYCECTHEDGRECPRHVCDAKEWLCRCI